MRSLLGLTLPLLESKCCSSTTPVAALLAAYESLTFIKSKYIRWHGDDNQVVKHCKVEFIVVRQ